MDCYETRLQSFHKTRRVKTKNGTVILKWPHPDTYLATPERLAEAGFYFEPSAEARDNAICFMCKKELDEWDEDDDPISIHFARCRDICAWAVARCGNVEDLDASGGFTFKDPSRAPTSKIMEKARRETFGSRWPHDHIRGHGANSKKMAKAGFLYAPHSAGDDTAICVYCTTTLSGWDVDDDPLEEHRKRVAKSGRRCAFFEMLEGSSKPTQPSRPTKSLPRSASQSLSKKKSAEAAPIVDDEVSSDGMSALTAITTAKSKRTTRASSVPAKTPGSRKSTRSAATSRSKAQVTPETDEDPEASGSEVGKRVSKSKKKGTKKAKDPIEVITELDEGGDLGGLEEEPPVQKPKRGRPPGKSKVAAAKAKKVVDPTPDASQVEPTSDILPSSSTRSRSKVITDDEPEPVAQTKPRSQPKTKTSAKQQKVEEASHDTELMPPPKAQPRSKAAKVSRTRPVEIDSDVEDVPTLEPQASEPRRHVKKTPSSQRPQEQLDGSAPQADAPSQAKGRKSSSTSDDAGYATAEQPMEVDDEHQRGVRSKSHSISRRENSEKHQAVPSEEPSGPTLIVDADVDMQDTTEPLRHSKSRQLSNLKAPPTISRQPSRSSGQTQVRVASRTTGSLARPPSRLGMEVVDISSDDDDELDVLKTISADKPLSASSTGSGTAPPTSIAPSSSSTFPPSKSSKQSPPIVSETIHRSTSNRSIGSSTTRVVEASAAMLPTTSSAASPDIEMMNTREQGMSDESHMKHPSAAKLKQNKAELEERLLNPSTPPPDTTSPPPSQVVVPSAHALPSFDEEFAAEEAHDKDPAVEALTPFLPMVSASKLASLTEDEGDLTLEQYILRELERQYQKFKEDGDRQIALFKQRAEEARKVIEAL